MFSTNSKQTGFTIIETMISVAILGIIVVAGAPSMQEFYERQKLNVGAEVINSALSSARSTSLNDLVQTKVCWNVGAVARTVDGVSIAPDQMVVYKINPVEIVSDFLFGDEMFIDDTDADDCALFDTQGRLDLTSISGASLMFGICKEAAELKDSKNVTVNQSGRALTRPNEVTGGGSLINCE